MYKGSTEFAVADTTAFGRTMGLAADSNCLEHALAGLILSVIGGNLIVMAVHDMPMQFVRRDTWAANFKPAFAVFVCFIVGVCCMCATTSAQVPMKAMATSNEDCNWWNANTGATSNLFCMVGSNATAGSSYTIPAGERFTLNTYNPLHFANGDASSYSIALYFSTVGLFVCFLTVNGVMSESIRMIKLAVFFSGFLWLALSWVFVYPGRDGSCGTLDGIAASSEEAGQCHQYVAGLTFLWLEAFFAACGGAWYLTKEQDAFNGNQEALQKVVAAPDATAVGVAAAVAVPENSYGITSTAV